MQRFENWRKVVKIFILVVLCSEMQSSLPQRNISPNSMETFPIYIKNEMTVQANVKYQASIRLLAQDYIFGQGHICSGTVIAPSVVLTTAQCIYNQKLHHPSELKVVMGTTNLFVRNKNTLVYSVTHINLPKTFDPHSLKSNIAILMLERDVPTTHPAVEPITLQLLVKMYNTSAKTDRQITDVTYSSCSSLKEIPELKSIHFEAETSRQPDVNYADIIEQTNWIVKKIGNGHHQNGFGWGTVSFFFFTLFSLKTTKFVKL